MFKKRQNYGNKGFSLLEVLIVIAIFLILTSVIIFNYRSFDENIVMTNVAYELALSIREAQVFSTGVRGINGNFDNKLGVYFDLSNKKNFISFADNDDVNETNNQYAWCNSGTSECSINNCTSGADNECQSLSTLTRNIEIDRICVSNEDNLLNGSVCDNSFGHSASKLAIIFSRPDPDAIIKAQVNSSIGMYNNAVIILKSPNGAKRAIYIKKNGQISVDFLNN